MANHNGPLVRWNTLVPIFKDRYNKALCPNPREAMRYSQIEKLLEIKNEDRSSHFKDLNLVSFNIFSFPISKLINKIGRASCRERVSSPV